MDDLERSARNRIRISQPQQMHSIEAIQNGTPLQAEPVEERAVSRITAQARFTPEAAMVRGIVPHEPEPREEARAERIWGATEDFVGVAFLERGVNAARTVGRVAYRDGRPQGTGFLVAPGLFLTNNHVLESAADCGSFAVEFDYEIDATGRQREPSRFEFAPGEFFITDDRNDLDYTLVAIGPLLDGPLALDNFGHCPLSAAGNKHMLGEVANIVQHPDGRLKEVVLRENRLVSRLDFVLHYVADTEPGSSGSPVFNNQWQAIALHHWGGPWRQDRGPRGEPLPRFVNEGIRISAIVDELRDRRNELSAAQAARLDEAVHLGERTAGVPVAKETPALKQTSGVVVRPDGTAVWRVPIEIAVGLPGIPTSTTVLDQALTAPPPAPVSTGEESFRRDLDTNYENRKGYRERFIRGHPIPMPGLSAAVEARAAKNLEAESGDDEFEFPYQHFSVYVDGTRGLPLVAACNIDGKNLKDINRKTGAVTRAEGLEVESAPEAREKWYTDPRIDPTQCGNDSLYTTQQVSAGSNRTSRIFHRGHMVRRLDPCWGSKKRALRAEADTFHFTNCTPQIGAFNSGHSLWQGIENHVLDNARVEDQRVTVFTGPVLADDDPAYRQNVFRGFRVPRLFWKIAVWKDGGVLSALAMIADQSSFLDREMPEGTEGIGDTEDVEDFIGTVPEVERLTGLDFGAAVRNADLYEDAEGAESRGRQRVRRFDQIRLERVKPRGKATRRRSSSRRKPDRASR